MNKDEIIVNKNLLVDKISCLKQLAHGTGYSVDCLLIDRGSGKTHDELNQMFNDLKSVESSLMELIETTACALENGLLNFCIIDNMAGEKISSINKIW